MNSPVVAASSISGSIRPNMIDAIQAQRTELDLTRASQLTLLRLQLALHKSDRRVAMQALDDLLDIDAEMEGLATTLTDIAAHPAGDTPLSGFIELQKAAIAAEKHALTGGDLRSNARSIAISAPGDGADNADLLAQPLFSEDEAESDDRTGRKGRAYVLVAAIAVIILGCGLMAYLYPTLLDEIVSFFGFRISDWFRDVG